MKPAFRLSLMTVFIVTYSLIVLALAPLESGHFNPSMTEGVGEKLRCVIKRALK